VSEAFEAEPGRLDAVVAAHLGVPRAEVQRAIAAGTVLVDGTPLEKSHRLVGGERIEVDLAPSAELPREGPALRSPGRTSTWSSFASRPGCRAPTENRRGGSVVNRLLGMGIPLSIRGGPLRPGIVHRLDAGTSGLLVVASDDPTDEALAAMFKAHEAERRYLALVRGSVPHDRFEVDAPLGRAAGGSAWTPPAADRHRPCSRFASASTGDAARGRTMHGRTRSGAPVLGRAPILGIDATAGEGTTRASSAWNAPSCTRGVSRSTTRSPGSGSIWRIRCPRIWRRPSGGSGEVRPA
jgi:hypothetical protein